MAAVFLSIGECMVELTPDGRGRYLLGFAGDTFNTAWYARRALPPDVTVAYRTAVGCDPLSDRLLAFMEDEGVVPDAGRIDGATVGLYLVHLENGERSFTYWRETSAARRLVQGLARLPHVRTAGDMAYLSGITLAILPQDDRGRLLDRIAAARRQGVTVAFDPNLRPALWEDADGMRTWVSRTAAQSDIVLPSFDDEATHFGDADPGVTLARYRSGGASTVIVKDGAGPVCGIAPDGTESRVEPPVVAAVVDTTAAGDSFNAATLAALMEGQTLREAMEAGCRLAAKVVTRRGALVQVADGGAPFQNRTGAPQGPG
jgi:2-dehydro-3-deoxygluconokinase